MKWFQSFDDWHQSGVWTTTKYKGLPCQQSPCDLWSIQEIIHETKPTCTVCTGVAGGGTLKMISDFMQSANPGISTRAIGIDIELPAALLDDRSLTLIRSDSVSEVTIREITIEAERYERVMVVLDSDHSKNHVAAELSAYASLVSRSCYLIVEDTCIGQTCCFDFGAGPNEALAEWLPRNPGFVVDRNRERWSLTQHPGGYLKRLFA